MTELGQLFRRAFEQACAEQCDVQVILQVRPRYRRLPRLWRLWRAYRALRLPSTVAFRLLWVCLAN